MSRNLTPEPVATGSAETESVSFAGVNTVVPVKPQARGPCCLCMGC